MFVAMDGRPLTDFPQVAAEFLVEIVGPPIQPVHGDHVVLEFVSGRKSGPYWPFLCDRDYPPHPFWDVPKLPAAEERL